MVADLITQFANMSLNELIAFTQNKDNRSLDIGICSVYINMIKSGDPSRMTLLLDRTAGRVKETHEHQIVGSVQSQILDTIVEIEKANQLEVQNGKKTSQETIEETTKEIKS